MNEFACFGSDGRCHKVREIILYEQIPQYGKPPESRALPAKYQDGLANEVLPAPDLGDGYFRQKDTVLRRFDADMIKRWVAGGEF